MIDPNQQSEAVRARHAMNATMKLLSALHYLRFFEEFHDDPAARSIMRRDANDRKVAALALQAGQSARYSGRPCESWAVSHPEAWGIPEIRQAMLVGWAQTDADLISCTDVVDGSVAS